MKVEKLQKISIIIIFVYLIYIPMIYAQPNTLWTKTLGGNDWDYGIDVQQTTDQGFIITGTTYSFGAGNGDVWLVKTDSAGNMEWNQTFGGTGRDAGNSVQKTTDGGYVITGRTESFGAGNFDVWLIKTDKEGNEEWSKTFGGTDKDIGYSVQQTSDGGYIIVGTTKSYDLGEGDIWLIKTDSLGNSIWKKTFGGNKYDTVASVFQSDDGGYVLVGSTDSYGSGNQDVWLIKINSSGNKIWSKTFGGNNSDGAHCIARTNDSGYIITGFTWSFGKGNADLWLIKTDSSGNEIWNKTIGGSDHDDGSSVQQTMDGGYIITGWTESFGSAKMNAWLVKTDASGNKTWSKAFGGNNIDMGYSVKQTADGGYIITGYTNSHTGGSNDDLWLIRIAPELTGVDRNSVSFPYQFLLGNNFPNPFNPVTTIPYQLPKAAVVNLSIYDLSGKLVEQLVNDKLQAGQYTFKWDAGHLSSGVYIYKIRIDDLAAGEFSATGKCLLLK